MVDWKANPGATNDRPLSRYEILDKIGEGGMGEVFLARDTMLERRVALKFLPEKLQQDRGARERFLREAKSAAALDHPFICKIYEIGGEGAGPEGGEDRPFIAMEYVHGESLSCRLQRGPLALDDALRLASEIAEALETAHGEGIVHRDLKPSNIMVTESDHVKVVDFGLAKRVESSAHPISELQTARRLTRTGMAMGTPAYMSPEQIRAEPVDRRSDIFSFGVVLYEMLTGVHPFAKGTSMDTVVAILTLATPLLSRHQRELPELLDHVVGKMTAKSPGERYQQVREVRIDLNGIRKPSVQGVTTEAPEMRPVARTRARTFLGVGAVAILALLAGGAWWMGSTGSGETRSVAVLPLRNLNDDGGLLNDDEHIAQGISRAVTTRLTQVGLRVTPFDTALSYADSDDPRRVAQELKVDAVLIGTLQIVNDRMLVTLSMVDAESGLQSWADTFEEPSLESIFDVQKRIAEGAATSLMGRLTGEQQEILAIAESRSADAWDAYMQGSYLLQEDTQDGTEVALQWFNEAVRRDPTMAQAHVGLGAAYEARYWYFGGSGEDLNAAKESYEKALELNPASMEARRGLVIVHFLRGETELALIQGEVANRLGRPDDIETMLTRATAYGAGGLHDLAGLLLRRILQVEPQYQEARFWLVVFSWQTESQQAIETANDYLATFGYDAIIHQRVAMAHHLLGNTELALEHYRKATGLGAEADSTSRLSADLTTDAVIFGGILYEQMGDREQAERVWRLGRALLEDKLRSAPDSPRSTIQLASLLVLLGDPSPAERKHILEAEAEVGVLGSGVLAAALARRGDLEGAVDVLERLADFGNVGILWKTCFKLAAVPYPNSDAFDRFLADYETQRRQYRREYGFDPDSDPGR